MRSHISAAVLVLAWFVGINATAETAKLIDTTLYESNEETFRWSEASTINMDGRDHLFMAVTLFGGGGHDHSTAQILGFHSYDGGLTWPGQDEGVVLQDNVGEQNTMSPALLELDNGDILCFVNVKNSLQDCGPWVKRSTDGGKTWGELSRLPYKGYGGVGSDRAIQIGTGRVLLPCWVSLDSLESTRLWVFRSDDRGDTWQTSPIISTPAGSTGRKTDPAAEEPMIIELKDGRLMMIMRTYLKSIYKCYSGDGGATWSEPVSSGVPSPGSMATIRRLPNGDILLIWNWASVEKISGPWPRNYMSSAISKDDGRNFSSVRHLDGADDFDGKITMANVVFADDNKVVITYSKSMTKKNAYNWRLQVIPLQWFYEGDMTRAYGEDYLPELEALVGTPGQVEPRKPSPEDRAAAMKVLAEYAAADGKEEGLVAAYHFERNAGPFAYDTAGTNDLTFIQSREWPRWADSQSGRSGQFDGKGGYLAAPDSEFLRFPGNRFTVEALIYPTAVKSHGIIVTKEHMFEVGLLDGRLKAAVKCGGSWGPGWLGDAEVPLREWTRIAVSFDGETLRFRVNGQPAGEATRTGVMDTTEDLFCVGGCTHITDSVFAGHIDELRVWRSLKDGTQ